MEHYIVCRRYEKYLIIDNLKIVSSELNHIGILAENSKSIREFLFKHKIPFITVKFTYGRYKYEALYRFISENETKKILKPNLSDLYNITDYEDQQFHIIKLLMVAT